MTTTPRFQPMPPLSDDEYAALKEDIRQNGQIYPIQIDEDGNILDGHNRNTICIELHIPPKYEVVKGLDDDAKWNLALRAQIRRNLTPEQKRELIVNELTRDAERSDRVIATLLAVDARTVARQRHLLFDAPDPVIPDPRVLSDTLTPCAQGVQLSRNLELLDIDYPMETAQTVEGFENYVLWTGERLLAYYATLDLSDPFLLVPIMCLEDALALYKMFDWRLVPQAAAIWARINTLYEDGQDAQGTRLRAMDDATYEAEKARQQPALDQANYNEWGMRAYLLEGMRNPTRKNAA